MSAENFILDYCMGPHMGVDWHRIFVRGVCEDAFPPTGEKDYRGTGIPGVSRGEFASLALAFGGHRPCEGQTTRERMEQALNAGTRRFRVHFREEDAGYEVHRIK